MDCITKVALKKSLDMFKIPFWSSTVEKGNQAHKGPQRAAVVMSIPWGQGVLTQFIYLYV